MAKTDGGGLRYNDGKVPISLVPPSAIRAIARVFGYGAKKYAPRNWERGMKWTIPYECAMRHLLAWMDGEENDKESGLPHLEHAICNLAILIEYQKTYRQGDDRPSAQIDDQTKKGLLMYDDSLALEAASEEQNNSPDGSIPC